jgi:hypothetical protein
MGAGSAPHFGQTTGKGGVPQAAQNFLPLVLSVPQLVQRIRLTLRDSDWPFLYHRTPRALPQVPRGWKVGISSDGRASNPRDFAAAAAHGRAHHPVRSHRGPDGDAGEMLDAQAKVAYKRRTAELREQLEEARELNQFEVVDRLEDEIETLGRELSRAVGLGGRDRRAASTSERARINVTRAIKIALERIAEHNPALATLLTSSIRTGTFCSYTPDSRLPAAWQL